MRTTSISLVERRRRGDRDVLRLEVARPTQRSVHQRRARAPATARASARSASRRRGAAQVRAQPAPMPSATTTALITTDRQHRAALRHAVPRGDQRTGADRDQRDRRGPPAAERRPPRARSWRAATSNAVASPPPTSRATPAASDVPQRRRALPATPRARPMPRPPCAGCHGDRGELRRRPQPCTPGRTPSRAREHERPRPRRQPRRRGRGCVPIAHAAARRRREAGDEAAVSCGSEPRDRPAAAALRDQPDDGRTSRQPTRPPRPIDAPATARAATSASERMASPSHSTSESVATSATSRSLLASATRAGVRVQRQRVLDRRERSAPPVAIAIARPTSARMPSRRDR